MEYEFVSNSVAETVEFGRKIGERLKGGEVFALIGTLGSGKTHLIKGIAAGAAGDEGDNVNSPTFVIVNEYVGRLHVYHIDAYRLDSAGEFEMLGFDDYCRPDAVVLIEWADKVSKSLDGVDLITVKLSHEGQTQRRIRISGAPEEILISKY